VAFVASLIRKIRGARASIAHSATTMTIDDVLENIVGLVFAVTALSASYAISLYVSKKLARRVGFLRSIAFFALLIPIVFLLLLIEYLKTGASGLLVAALFVLLAGAIFLGVARLMWSTCVDKAR
jgi:hypothetical protein